MGSERPLSWQKLPVADRLAPAKTRVLAFGRCRGQVTDPEPKKGVFPMAADPRKRQKQQERRASKRKSKQHLMVKEKHAGMPARLAAATRYPILHCLVTQSLWDQGLGWVCLSRELP